MKAAAGTSTFRVLREAVHAYPAVKFAFGVAAVLGGVGLAFVFAAEFRLAILSLIPSLALLIALWLFAHARHHAAIDFELPANIFIQAALVVSTAATLFLFATLVFGIPRTMKKIEGLFSFATLRGDTDRPVLFAGTDSAWGPKRQKPEEICAVPQAIYAERYPAYEIDVVVTSSVRTDGAQDFYQYHCAFQATPK